MVHQKSFFSLKTLKSICYFFWQKQKREITCMNLDTRNGWLDQGVVNLSLATSFP